MIGPSDFAPGMQLQLGVAREKERHAATLITNPLPSSTTPKSKSPILSRWRLAQARRAKGEAFPVRRTRLVQLCSPTNSELLLCRLIASCSHIGLDPSASHFRRSIPPVEWQRQPGLRLRISPAVPHSLARANIIPSTTPGLQVPPSESPAISVARSSRTSLSPFDGPG